MSEEVRPSKEVIEVFVSKLKEFRDALPETEQAMMDTILQSTQGQSCKRPRSPGLFGPGLLYSNAHLLRIMKSG